MVGISSLKPSGVIEYQHPTYVLGLGSKSNLVTVDEKSVIVIRTNGNPDRIGNVYLATPDVAGCAVSAFTFCCAFKSREQADFAFEYMSGRTFQRWATSLVAGSTGLNESFNRSKRPQIADGRLPAPCRHNFIGGGQRLPIRQTRGQNVMICPASALVPASLAIEPVLPVDQEDL